MAQRRLRYAFAFWIVAEALRFGLPIVRMQDVASDWAGGVLVEAAFAQGTTSDWSTVRLLIPCWDTPFSHRHFVRAEHARRTAVEVYDECGRQRLRFLNLESGMIEITSHTGRRDESRLVVPVSEWGSCTPAPMDSGQRYVSCSAGIDAHSGQRVGMAEWTPGPNFSSVTEGFVAVRMWTFSRAGSAPRFELWHSEWTVCYLDAHQRVSELACIDLRTSSPYRINVDTDDCLTRMWYSQESGLCWYNDVGYRVGRYPDRTRPTRDR